MPRTLTSAAFLWHIAQHVLPSGFRRVREHGFLHHNAVKTLQRVLQISLQSKPPKARPLCRHCQNPTHCIAVTPKRLVPS